MKFKCHVLSQRLGKKTNFYLIFGLDATHLGTYYALGVCETDKVSFENAGLHMRRPNHKHKKRSRNVN